MNDLISLDSVPAHSLRGVGATVADALIRLEIHTVRDLLLHLPIRYQDKVNLVNIKNLQVGQEAAVKGVIVDIKQAYGRKRTFRCTLEDDTGKLSLVFFQYRKAQFSRFKVDLTLRCFGPIRRWQGRVEMAQPEYRLIEENSPQDEVPNKLTPVYRLVKGLSQNHLRRLMSQALAMLDKNSTDPVDRLFNDGGLPRAAAAIHLLHEPEVGADLPLLATQKQQAHRRLAWEELLAQLLATMRLKAIRLNKQAVSLRPEQGKIKDFLDGLPFEPTQAQHKAIDTLLADLARPQPMLRLLQGDVGAGKTLVATAGLLAAVETGGQAALMVPTEVLAIQHFETLKQWQLPGILLTSRTSPKEKARVLDRIKYGQTCIVIGTHALFQEKVRFENLVLIVIDEQHKFGVHQRLALQEKGRQPHRLIMTATPIPRTLAMSLYSDLSVSVLDELPKGRQPIITVAAPKQRSATVMQRVQNVCKTGRQAYWVCPFIETSEEAEGVAAAEEVCAELKKTLPEMRIGMLHGRLTSRKKEKLMAAFHAAEVDILVATTVIEVGIDIPNATVMVIENAERLGLAQMHQLRGRVGRGQQTSYCVLLYQPPLSDHGKKRLQVMRSTTDGFEIAEKDLELRGAGELLGSQQTGRFALRIANLMTEARHLPHLRKQADKAVRYKLDDIIIARWLPEAERLGQA